MGDAANRRHVPTAQSKQPWLKPGVLLGALVPLGALVWRAVGTGLGADPVAVALNQLGLLALIFLIASLSASPLRSLFGVSWPIRIRRLLGLLSFFYASLHVLLYVAVDQGFAWSAIAADITERKFIALGFGAFVLLIPLAITSTSGMLKRLGSRRWKRLHRLAYVAGVLASLHFIVRVKRDLSEPLAYALVLGLVLGLRLLPARRSQAGRAP